MTITVRTGDAPQIEAFLVERIYEYNAAATGHGDSEPFTAVRESTSGEIDAGISGYTWCGCCYIADLWVAETARGRGMAVSPCERLSSTRARRLAASCS